ncbi:hypothetical protein AGMMS49936_05590 [Endomicrobiia bacterium]|nr:hypothetical protein AGMMS49936_05590 [Endomicrobiia bacterium]
MSRGSVDGGIEGGGVGFAGAGGRSEGFLVSGSGVFVDNSFDVFESCSGNDVGVIVEDEASMTIEGSQY